MRTAHHGAGGSLAERVSRLEATEEIRQLAAKYAIALDMRDLDSLVGLFPGDVQVSRELRGRSALKKWFDDTLRHQFKGTAHVTGNHIIEFDDETHARGLVYSRNEHESDGQWVIMTMIYWDRYECVEEGGRARWLFRRRLPLYWYATDLNRPPVGEAKMRWPGRAAYEGGYHVFFPTWEEFWSKGPPSDAPDVAEPAPVGGFLERLRRGASEAQRVRVR